MNELPLVLDLFSGPARPRNRSLSAASIGVVDRYRGQAGHSGGRS